jgi:hypothetical protein
MNITDQSAQTTIPKGHKKSPPVKAPKKPAPKRGKK